MSKLIGLAAVDWSYCRRYVSALERSRRTRLADWEVELKRWNPEDETTMPSNYALATMREAVRELV